MTKKQKNTRRPAEPSSYISVTPQNRFHSDSKWTDPWPLFYSVGRRSSRCDRHISADPSILGENYRLIIHSLEPYQQVLLYLEEGCSSSFVITDGDTFIIELYLAF